jgi:adenosylcobinamide kinase / adenosylcobinamide-phosphate guanylyltransferase
VALAMLLGGARSGKSRLAVELAAAARRPVTVIATGEAGDPEMAERIAAHSAERPEGWVTVEEPYALEEALARAQPTHAVIVDCLTLWVANSLGRDDDSKTILDAAARAAASAAARSALTVAVSNEVGLGVVPVTPLGRAYRDLLGSVNRIWVDASADAALVVAGRALALADAQVLAGSVLMREAR